MAGSSLKSCFICLIKLTFNLRFFSFFWQKMASVIISLLINNLSNIDHATLIVLVHGQNPAAVFIITFFWFAVVMPHLVYKYITHWSDMLFGPCVKVGSMCPEPSSWTWSQAPWTQSAPDPSDRSSDLTTLSSVRTDSTGDEVWNVACQKSEPDTEH